MIEKLPNVEESGRMEKLYFTFHGLDEYFDTIHPPDFNFLIVILITKLMAYVSQIDMLEPASTIQIFLADVVC